MSPWMSVSHVHRHVPDLGRWCTHHPRSLALPFLQKVQGPLPRTASRAAPTAPVSLASTTSLRQRHQGHRQRCSLLHNEAAGRSAAGRPSPGATSEARIATAKSVASTTRSIWCRRAITSLATAANRRLHLRQLANPLIARRRRSAKHSYSSRESSCIPSPRCALTSR